MFEMLQGDARDVLPRLEASSVQVCVTSPPYLLQRNYEADGQIGQEDGPDAYVAELVKVFREVRRILRPDGVLWLNLGPTYAGGGGYSPNAPSNRSSKQSTNRGVLAAPKPIPKGYQAKDLIPIPWLAAMALQEDGWILRADVIWEKPNAFPEAVRDRPTRSHEYVFMLVKRQRYYYDADMAREEGKAGWRNRRSVWRIPVAAVKGHHAVFPEELVERCVLPCSREGDVVLDPFAGSGTTGLVALRHGRRFIGVELNETYCELAQGRLADLSNVKV